MPATLLSSPLMKAYRSDWSENRLHVRMSLQPAPTITTVTLGQALEPVGHRRKLPRHHLNGGQCQYVVSESQPVGEGPDSGHLRGQDPVQPFAGIGPTDAQLLGKTRCRLPSIQTQLLQYPFVDLVQHKAGLGRQDRLQTGAVTGRGSRFHAGAFFLGQSSSPPMFHQPRSMREAWSSVWQGYRPPWISVHHSWLLSTYLR